MNRTGILVAVLGLAAVDIAVAGTLHDAVSAYKSGDYALALRLVRLLDGRADADAYFYLYLDGAQPGGMGAPQGYAEALAWFGRITHEDRYPPFYTPPPSTVDGLCYGASFSETAPEYRHAADIRGAVAGRRREPNGRGEQITHSDALAATWHRMAASEGDATAQFELGVAYDDGKGAPQDHAEAVKWFQQAAERGDPRAQLRLGFNYALGEGVRKDLVQAHTYFALAAKRFTSREKDKREAARIARDSIAAEMTSKQLEEAWKQASAWKPKKPKK